MRRVPHRLVCAALAGSLLGAGCGGSGGGATNAPATAPPAPTASSNAVRLTADPGGKFAYDLKRVEVKAGGLKVQFHNPADIVHDVTLARGTKVIARTPKVAKKSAELSTALKPGAYVFYCSVPGHRAGGMEGKLVVR